MCHARLVLVRGRNLYPFSPIHRKPFVPYQLSMDNLITVVTRFQLPAGVTADQIRAAFDEAAPGFRNVPGLVSSTPISQRMLAPRAAFACPPNLLAAFTGSNHSAFSSTVASSTRRFSAMSLSTRSAHDSISMILIQLVQRSRTDQGMSSSNSPAKSGDFVGRSQRRALAARR